MYNFLYLFLYLNQISIFHLSDSTRANTIAVTINIPSIITPPPLDLLVHHTGHFVWLCLKIKFYMIAII